MLYTLNLHNWVLCLVAQLCLTLWPHELWPTRLLHLWDFPGKIIGMGCHALLQGIFPTQGSNSSLPYCRQILYHLSQQRSLNLCQLYLKNIHTQNLSKNTLDKKNLKKTFRGTVLISQIRSLAFSSPLELLVSSHFPILSWSKERCFSPRGEECQPNTLPASEYGMNEKIRVFAFFLLKTLGLCLLPAFPLWGLAF